jgi:hypothetical protein
MAMRQTVVPAVAAGLLVVAALLGVQRKGVAGFSGPVPLGIELDVRPAADAPDEMIAQAKLKDLTTGRVFSTPVVQFKKGQTSQIRQGIAGFAGGVLLEINVGVTPDGKVATYTATTQVGIADGNSLRQTQAVTFDLAE